MRSRSQQECSNATLQRNEKRINKQQLFAFVQLKTTDNNNDNRQLLDEVEQNIVSCQRRADQLFAEAEK